MRNKKAWIFWESRRKYSDYSVISLCVYGNPGCTFTPEFTAPELLLHPELFKDEVHLNSHGADLFTHEFISVIHANLNDKS